jgi:hypothetical protein
VEMRITLRLSVRMSCPHAAVGRKVLGDEE